MWWNTFYNTEVIIDSGKTTPTKAGSVLVIDEMEINIEVIEVALTFEIEPIMIEIDVALKVESNDLKFDIECL